MRQPLPACENLDDDNLIRIFSDSPYDQEFRNTGMLGGSWYGIRCDRDEWWNERPLPELARYRTPIEGLYLGHQSSAHPGGSVPDGCGLQPDAHYDRRRDCRTGRLVVPVTVVYSGTRQDISHTPLKQERRINIMTKELTGKTHPQCFIPEFPPESEWDVVVIGAGPNGLMTAAYLEKAGLKVVLVERRYEIGGGLATEEILFPGYYSNIHAVYHLMVDYMPVLKDFDLSRHGLVWIKPNLQTSMIFEDGKSLLLARMIEDTADSIHKFSTKDAIAYGRTMRTWRRIVREIVAPATYLPPMAPIDVTMAIQKTDIGKEMLELAEQSPLDIINNPFENDRVRALFLYVSCMWGLDPRETGMGFFVPLLIDRGINKCYCQGGSHKLGNSLAREFVRAGGTILDASQVNNIIMQNGNAKGVELWEGRTLHSNVVISSLDPHTTFLDLVGAENLPEDLKDMVEPWK